MVAIDEHDRLEHASEAAQGFLVRLRPDAGTRLPDEQPARLCGCGGASEQRAGTPVLAGLRVGGRPGTVGSVSSPDTAPLLHVKRSQRRADVPVISTRKVTERKG